MLHLQCNVHSMRTIDRHFKGESYRKARGHMIAALVGRKTGPGCEISIRQAIAASPDQKTRDYIWNNWWPTRQNWAIFARQHSCLLMQVQTTNAVEAWHSALKSTGSLTQFSLTGCVNTVAALATQYDARAEKAAAQFRTYVIGSLLSTYLC